MGFKPIAMSEVNLFVQTENLEDVTNLIYDLKLVEFFKIEKDNFETFEHEDLNELSSRLLKLRSSIRILNKYFKIDTKKRTDDPLDSTIKTKNKLDESEKDLIHFSDELKRSQILKELKVTQKDLKAENVSIGFVSIGKSRLLNVLSKSKIKFRTFKTKQRTYFIAYSDKIPFEFKEFYLPKKIEENLEMKVEKTQNRISKAKVDLRKIANGNLEHLKSEEIKLSKEIEMLESKPNFLKTENFTVISGYMPTNYIRKLKIELVKTLSDKFDITTKDAGEDAPIQLDHMPSVSNFQMLLNMYSMPKYNEIDPTFILFLTFPLFFGFILGDVLYGLISLFFFTWLKKKMPEAKSFMSIFQLSAISSIIFGVIFGEFMGYEIHGAFYGFFERSHHPELLLIYAVIFGIAHINLGLLVGFLNEMKSMKKAICDKLSLVVLQVGIGLLAYGIHIASNLMTIFGAVAMIFAFILIYMGHGFIGIMEVPSFFTNILSYSRLMAVGLSSIVIATLVNNYSAVFFSGGIGGKIAGITLFTIGHIFNIIIGNFEGFVHTLRLHYVEFFTKFYSGGGREFIPFGTRKE